MKKIIWIIPILILIVLVLILIGSSSENESKEPESASRGAGGASSVNFESSRFSNGACYVNLKVTVKNKSNTASTENPLTIECIVGSSVGYGPGYSSMLYLGSGKKEISGLGPGESRTVTVEAKSTMVESCAEIKGGTCQVK